MLYPLKFKPILKERIWGGDRLVSDLGKKSDLDHLGESWEISGVEGNVSIVSNGSLSGQSLSELSKQFSSKLLGTEVIERFGLDFPILIKFIDTAADLSVQVHPNDQQAKIRHKSFGKTEMWYILDADTTAQINVGFKEGIDRNSYEKHLKSNSLDTILHYEKVKPGDTFLIDAGTVHAIGKGIMLAEIQQTSDITYRIYDYNRTDHQGNYRTLHTKEALEIINFGDIGNFKKSYKTSPNQSNNMVSCPYFITNYIKVDRPTSLPARNSKSFVIIICISGQGSLGNQYGSASFKKGETLLVPACSKYMNITSQKCELLEVFL